MILVVYYQLQNVQCKCKAKKVSKNVLQDENDLPEVNENIAQIYVLGPETEKSEICHEVGDISG